MPKVLDRFVQDRLKDESFYPEKSDEDRTSLAWALANKLKNEGHLKGNDDEVPNELTFVQGITEFTVKAGDAGGRILLFKGAVLARAERNTNGDEISKDNISELVATLPATPIDDEHNEHQIIGMFTDSRPTEDGLAASVDGLIHMDRFPEIAADIQSGKRQLSVEADADEAECSKCGGRFRSSHDYCAHLAARRKTGTSRRFHNMVAKGGGVVKRPAGTRTHFDPSQIRIIASHQEADEKPVIPKMEDSTMKCPHCEASNDEGADKCKSCGKNMAVGAIIADLNAALAKAGKVGELETQLTAKDEELTTAKAEIQTKIDALASKDGDLKTANDKVVELTAAIRRSRLAAWDDKKWDDKKATVMAMADDAFDLMAAEVVSPTADKGGAGFRLPDRPVAGGNRTNGTKEPLAL